MAQYTRLLSYFILPLILAAVHILLNKQATSLGRRLEIVLMWLFGVSVGANGLGGFFGHWFLADTVAESIGWATGSPFQLEVAFANLALGLLGIIAIGRRGDFRVATVIAAATFGFGASIVHFKDILETGNLAPGNTIINVSNIGRPLLLIGLMIWQGRVGDLADEASDDYARWHGRQALVVALAAAGIGTGFGVGFIFGATASLVGAVAGGVLGAGLGWIFGRQR